MKKVMIILLFGISMGISAQTGDEILAMVDKALFLDQYTSTVRMETTDPGSSPKIMVFDTQSRKDSGAYLEIKEPATSKGTRFLQLNGSLWIYNPKGGNSRPLQLSSRESFQGSTFSNSDVGKSQYSDDYKASFVGEKNLDKTEEKDTLCYVIDSASQTTNAAYSKIRMWVRKSDQMPLRMEYYARSGALFKQMDLSKVKKFGSITRPSIMRMESFEKTGSITTITFVDMKEANVPKSVFNKNFLTR